MSGHPAIPEAVIDGGDVAGLPLRVWIVQIGDPIAGLDVGERAHRCEMLANAMLDRGHEVVWWSSTFRHRTKSYRFHGPHTVVLRPGLTLRLLHGRPGYRRNVAVARWLNQRAVARAFEMATSTALPPDLIVACLPTPEMCEVAVRFGRRTKVPVVVDVRDPWPEVYLSVVPPAARGIAKRLLSFEYRRAARLLGGASGLTAVSEAYLDWGVAHGNRQASEHHKVFPLGYQSRAFAVTDPSFASPTIVRARYGIPAGSQLVVFSGTFGRSYDLETIVDCAAMTHREGRADVHVVLAGDGDRMSRIRRRSSNLPNITLTGWLDHRSLAELIEAASIGLCAYAPQATQTLPYKSFEYMAAGLPLVSSLGGELADLIRTHDLGRQYDAGVAASLKSAILSILDAPTAREQMGRNARALLNRRFDARRIYPEMAAFVESFALQAAARFR